VVIIVGEVSISQSIGVSAASRVAAEIQEMSLQGEPEQPTTPSQIQEPSIPPDPASVGELNAGTKYLKRRKMVKGVARSRII
jgi:hypothetical protein